MFEKIQKVLADGLGVKVENIVPTARFVEDLNADSLDLMEIVMQLEDEFGVEIENEELENMKTVQDVMSYIEAHQ